ncbi:hypothetical protein INR49_010257 [Caranx melampygus]|nr:hypothetical protein INR49_010257 [Caranx melampygus]
MEQRPAVQQQQHQSSTSPASPEETPLHKCFSSQLLLCAVLCSALVAMAAELVQDQLSLTRRVGEPVSPSAFSWKRQKEGSSLEELPPAEGEQLELTEPGRSAAILLVDRGAFYTYKYHCYVKHEGVRGSPGSSPASVQGEAALSALHADSEESALLLWTPSADEPQKQGTIEFRASNQNGPVKAL